MERSLKSILRKRAMCLPESPGVYIMKDINSEIIYIGKAKNLKNRVSQYFGSDTNHADKVIRMVSNINNFEYIMTDSEYEALLLECNLIKQHMPKYNILLKDDKGYHYIKVSNERWKRILKTNKKDSDGSVYIGPFMSSLDVKMSLDEVLKIFKLPNCKRNFDRKSRPCLNYYINQCSAPCAGKISLNEYNENIKDAVSFIKRGRGEAINYMKREMEEASNSLNFEKAAKIRDRIKAIDRVKSKQKIILDDKSDRDIIAFVFSDSQLCMGVLKFEQGNLSSSENFIVDLTDNIQELKLELLQSYYTMKSSAPRKIFIDSEIDSLDLIEKWISSKNDKKIKIKVPSLGDNLKLIKMCTENAREYMIKTVSDNSKNFSLLKELSYLLGLENEPVYIEAYDISNIQGSLNVGGMVVYKDCKPVKSLYKKFMIKTVIGQDDYASMLEVIKRRFERFFSDSNEDGFNNKPDLILLDGGVGHTKKIKQYLKSLDMRDIPVFGMIKDSKHKTRAMTDGENEIDIKSYRNSFKFITKIQDEVHRFTIRYHINRRNVSLKSSELLSIKGVGKKRSQELLKRFKSLDRIAMASIDELMLIPGMTKPAANSVIEYFKKRRKI